MINKYMSTDAIINEMRDCESEIRSKTSGLTKKYFKQLKNTRIPNEAILGTSHYTINGNRINVKAIKEIAEVGKWYMASLALVCYFEVDGFFLIPLQDSLSSKQSSISGFLKLTKHSVDMIRERLGKDIDAFFEEDYIKKNEGSYCLKKYDWNQDEDEYVIQIGEAFCICNKQGQGEIVKTVLSAKEFYERQQKQILDSKMNGEKLDIRFL